MDTEDETKSKPMATNSGLRSGLARDTIFRNEDAVGGALANVPDRTSDSIGDFSSGVGDDVGLAPVAGGCVAKALGAMRRE
jgi:hypothetical protein